MIPSHVEDRIAQIRTAVRNERAAIADLNSKVTDLKQMLKPASYRLDDVETFFLACEILKEPRTDRQWAYWLDNAERALSLAIQHRAYVAELVAKFGPDARIMPPPK
jgi:hypothetical protein